MACALDYLGASTEQLEDAVFSQQDVLWALAEEALGYVVPSVEYAPTNDISGGSSPNTQRGTWLEPEEMEPPDLSELSLSLFGGSDVSANIDIEPVTIPERDEPQFSVSDPDRPGAFDLESPIAPTLELPPVQAAEDLREITEVILADLHVPSIVALTTYAAPSPPPELNLDIHTQTVDYSGSDYTPTATLVSKIMEWLGSGTRMPDAIWSMVIDKAVSQAMDKGRENSSQALSEWAAKGWEYIGGPAQKKLRQIQYGLLTIEQDKIAEVLAAGAKQELENLQLAVAQGTALEGQLVDAWNKERRRELSAAKATVKLAVDIINVKMSLVDARTAGYLAQAETYATMVKQAVLPYRRYALEVEAQSIDSLYNSNATKKYTAEMRNLLPYSKKFAAEMRSVKIIAEHNRNMATNYRTAVSAGAKQYLAKEEEWKGLLARNELPKLEAERHRILSASFAERTRAWLAGIELEGTKARANTAAKRGANQRVEQDIQRFIEEVSAQQADIDRKFRSWSAFYGSYDDYYSAWISAAGVDAANQQADLAASGLDNNAKIAKLKEDFEILAAQRRLQIEEDGGNAQIRSDLSAAMYNCIHVSSSVGSSQHITAASTCETTDNPGEV